MGFLPDSKMQYKCGMVPYGYYAKDKTLYPEPREQMVIEYMLELWRNDLSICQIAKRLEAKGYATRRGNKHWNDVTVSRIIGSHAGRL